LITNKIKLIAALKFLYHLQIKPANIVSKKCKVQIKQKVYTIKHYKRKYLSQKRSIVIFSGFSVEGYKDSRIVSLSKSIASIGFNVFVVAIPDIENLQISANTIEDMINSINYIASRKKFNRKGKVGVLAPSFSAGMALNACADKRLKNAVSAICAIGSFASIEDSIAFVMQKNDVDDYGRNIIFKNILPHINVANKEKLQSLIQTAIEDNGFKRNEELLPQLLQNSEKQILKVWQDYNENAIFRMELYQEAQTNFPTIKNWSKHFNVVDNIKQVKAKVFLLHGKTDNVISPEESKKLHYIRQENQLQSKLCISNVLDHGDTSISIKNVIEIYELSQFFSQFFKIA